MPNKKELTLIELTTSILVLLIAFLFPNNFLAQSANCGFKTECDCDTTIKSIKHSWQISHAIFEGTIIEMDTVSVETIMLSPAIDEIVNDTLENSICAKKVLQSEKVVRLKVEVHEKFKGNFNGIYLITPLKETNCAYSGFMLDKKYLFYATINSTADIYFLWTFDKDYFYLQPKYAYWTNKCKRTRLSNGTELKALRSLKKSRLE